MNQECWNIFIELLALLNFGTQRLRTYKHSFTGSNVSSFLQVSMKNKLSKKKKKILVLCKRELPKDSCIVMLINRRSIRVHKKVELRMVTEKEFANSSIKSLPLTH